MAAEGRAGGCLRQEVAARATVPIKSKSQGKQIYLPILTIRVGMHTGAESLAQELGGDPREVGTD